ncbi:alcohol dehydrogenase catalytic domain-containing protein [Pseudomonas fluorescens]|uniref:alcohol dehydrogenase catalytic domain-containing protein n=1 Tax=Pseudomonas fluorescens TaxID=294 RepID=UPI001242E749|nr:zinc-binding dehydrogenase [Pseudomonas fluorescens]VVN43667.1 Putative inactive phenolphthiocerol synthesis polyketide synthase type I Pks1 [Pseudomonas fluorescens]
MKPVTSMKAAILENYFEPFRYATVARPVPSVGQVLVSISASGINPQDLSIRIGEVLFAKYPLPAILGIDLAGVVAATGPGVTSFVRGDEVFGLAGGKTCSQGTLAEFAVVDARLLALKPTNLSMREAAAIPLAFCAAWEGLVSRAQLKRGDTVLILDGKSDIAHMAIQISVALGAKVYATGTGRKCDLIKELGAIPIDPDEISVDQYVADNSEGRGFDIVFDTAGGRELDTAFRAVKYFGYVVSTYGWGSHSLVALATKSANFSAVSPMLLLTNEEGRGAQSLVLQEATHLVESGRLLPIVDRHRFGLQSVNEAYELLASGGADGKLIVDVQ